MCIAVAAEVLAFLDDGRSARVSVAGNETTVEMGLVDAKPGDHVLVHAGCALEVIREDTAREIADLYGEIEAIMAEAYGGEAMGRGEATGRGEAPGEGCASSRGEPFDEETATGGGEALQ